MRDLSGLPPKMKRGGAALVAAADHVKCANLGEGGQYTAVGLEAGELTLYYTRLFAESPEAMRAELLEHEAAHVAMDFFGRGATLLKLDECKDCKGRSMGTACVVHAQDWKLWNTAHDCAINHSLDMSVLPEGVSYEALKLPVVPAEIAYELLKRRQTEAIQSWCSHAFLGDKDIPMGLLPKLISLAREVQESMQMGGGIGRHSGDGGKIEVLPFVQRPKWMDELERLLMTRTRLTRKRTWMRDSRRPVYVRGRQRRRAPERTGLILLDTSGSMWGELPMLIAQITNYLPECEGAVWDTVASERGPVATLYDNTSKVGGGGTDPRCAAALRREGELCVWVTDCEVAGWPRMGEHDVIVRTGGGGTTPGGTRVIDASKE